MLQRIAAIVITLAGVALALVVGFWVLIILGIVALAASLVYFVRSRLIRNRERGEHRSDGNVIEGEFTVVDDEDKRDERH